MPPRDFSATPTLDPIEDITRRRLLTAIPALGLMASGISCGDEDTGAHATAEPSAGVSRFPVTIHHALGATTIPREPQRVVAVSEGEALDHVLAHLKWPRLATSNPRLVCAGSFPGWPKRLLRRPNFAARGSPNA